MSKSTSKVCRRCQERKPLETLLAKGNRWYCEVPCKWAKKIRPTKEQDDALDELVVIGQEIEEEEIVKEKFQPIEDRDIGNVLGVVVTSAQNNTSVNRLFLEALKNYCNHHQYALLVIPYTYKRTEEVNSYEDMNYDVAYAEELRSYLCPNKINFGSYTIQADLNLRPTTLNPLTSVQSLTEGRHSIFGHPIIDATALATPKGKDAIVLHTTGAVTRHNYRQQPAGKKAEFHHTYGAVVVHKTATGRTVHRLLNADDDGSFIDLCERYSAANTSPTRVELSAIVMGDIHDGHTAPCVIEATDEMIDMYQPEKIVLHDLSDGSTINHHEEKNPFAKFGVPFSSLQVELDSNCKRIDHYAWLVDQVVVVASNHNDFLNRWLQRADWRELDKATAKLYLELANLTIDGKTANTFGLYAQDQVKDNVTFLSLDESYEIAGIECGFHGHTGANGGKGSPVTFSKQAFKSVTGHIHYFSIKKGHMTAGTSTGAMSYCKGFSNWQKGHVFIYPNGKRQQILIHEDGWGYNYFGKD